MSSKCARQRERNSRICESRTIDLTRPLNLIADSIQATNFPDRKAKELQAEKKLQQEQKKHPYSVGNFTYKGGVWARLKVSSLRQDQTGAQSDVPQPQPFWALQSLSSWLFSISLVSTSEYTKPA